MSKESPKTKRVPVRNYRLHIPEGIERRLRRCRATVRQAIQARLAKIAQLEAARPLRRSLKVLAAIDPPLRFYTSESYRVSYRIDRELRKVVVLAFRWEVDA